MLRAASSELRRDRAQRQPPAERAESVRVLEAAQRTARRARAVAEKVERMNAIYRERLTGLRESAR